MGKLGIGKPQRSKKHKKLKAVDPFYFGDRKNRNVSLVNQCPQNTEDQELPRKLKFYIDKKPELKNYKRKKRKKNEKNKQDMELERGMSRPLKPVPEFIQQKHESDKKFLGRVERETKDVLLRSKVENQYGVEFDGSGRTVKKGMSDRKKEKLKERKKKKKMKNTWNMEDRKSESKFKDEILFGETVKQPPSLTAKPRKAQFAETVPRPGKRSLLLKDILDQNSNKDQKDTSSKRERGQTQKRKTMSFAQQRILDAERQRAIDLYRKLKNKKLKTS